jgi:hypothetical protein
LFKGTVNAGIVITTARDPELKVNVGTVLKGGLVTLGLIHPAVNEVGEDEDEEADDVEEAEEVDDADDVDPEPDDEELAEDVLAG